MLTASGEAMSDGVDDCVRKVHIATPPAQRPWGRPSVIPPPAFPPPASRSSLSCSAESSTSNSRTGSAVFPARTSPISRVKIETHPAPTSPISRVKIETDPAMSPARASLPIAPVDTVDCVDAHQGADETMQEDSGTRLANVLSAEGPIAHWPTNNPVDAQLTTPLLPPTPSHAPDTHTQQGNDPNTQLELPQELTLVPINLPRPAQTRNPASRSNMWPIPPPPTPLIPSASIPVPGIPADVDKPNALDTTERRELKYLRGQHARDTETVRKLKRRVLDLEQEAATMRKGDARKASTLQWLVHHPERALEIWTDVRRKVVEASGRREEVTVETEPMPRKRLRMEAVVIHVRPRAAAESTEVDGDEC